MRTAIGSLAAASFVLVALAAGPALAADMPLRADQAAFRDLYEELVETNTTLSSGSCTLAAERMAARLKAAGMPDSQITLFADPAYPREGGLVAVYPGTSTTLKPILAIAHIDVVEAKREDWARDPFTLIEEGGYFYGRGTADDKAMAAMLVDTLIRFQRTGHKPKRTVKIALTCGEETNGAFNGVEWLTANKRELIDAEFALNEGGGGTSDGKGKVVEQAMQVGEKTFATYRIETRNPGGHSSVPRPDNAIYQLAQRAGAYVNCRIFPGHSVDEIRSELARIIADPEVTVTALAPLRPSPPAPPLDPKVMGPAKALAAKYFPGVPVVPVMANGYTDSTFLTAVGIPAYGVPGHWGDPDGNGAHGLNERIEARSVYVGRDYLYDLIVAYAE